MKRVQVGTIGVDSGSVFISDPCYISKHPELSNPDKWDDYCKARFPSKTDYPQAMDLFDGVTCFTQHGDGEYPVYVTFDKEGCCTKIECDLTYGGMQIADLNNEEAGEKIQEGLSYLEDKDKVEVLEKLIGQYAWYEAKIRKKDPLMTVYKGKTSEKMYEKYWDDLCIWKPDILQQILSGVYRTEQAYDEAIEAFWHMSWKQLPEIIRNQVRLNCEGVTEDSE